MTNFTPDESLVRMEVLPNILCFQCIGQQSYDHTIRRFNMMYATLQSYGIWKVLVEGKTQRRLSILDSYNAIKHIKEGLGKDICKVKIAFLDERRQGFEHNTFAENVANNRGLCLRFFRDRHHALSWLGAES